MQLFLSIVLVILFIVMIVGLLKPSAVLPWVASPTRLKVLGYWFVSSVIIFLIVGGVTDEEDLARSSIKRSQSWIEEKNYARAISSLEDIDETNPLYGEAQVLLKEASDLLRAEEELQAKEEAIQRAADQQTKRTETKNQLKRELASINKGIDFSSYRGSFQSLNMELVLFGAWSMMIDEAWQYGDDLDIKRMNNQLANKVSALQKREYPKLRKEYATLLDKKLWKEDIEVEVSGNRNQYLMFTGAVFAANKNKLAFHQETKEMLQRLRFEQSRFRWYEGEDEYTYWEIFEGKDSDIQVSE